MSSHMHCNENDSAPTRGRTPAHDLDCLSLFLLNVEDSCCNATRVETRETCSLNVPLQQWIAFCSNPCVITIVRIIRVHDLAHIANSYPSCAIIYLI